MGLREKVKHLEKWYDKQVEIERLHTEVIQLKEEIRTVKKFLDIDIDYGYHIIEKKTKGE